MNFKQTASNIVAKRKSILDTHALSLSDAINNSPTLLELEKRLRFLTLTDAKGKKIDKKELAKLEKEKDSVLKKMGIAKTTPPPACKKCGDTAFIGNDFCACVTANTLTNIKNISIPLTDFTSIDYKKFDPAHLERNKSVFLDIQKLVDKYPLNKRRIITLLGSTGTGKTLLAGCATKHLLSKGFSAIAITAFDFVNRALKYHTTFDDNKLSFLEPLLIADLLVVDDLGTESILKNVTHEYLYSVLTERTASGKLMFFTSNLSKNGILDRYGERIYSRLFDKTIGYANILNGKDLRVSDK